jgi:hypothetical protein
MVKAEREKPDGHHQVKLLKAQMSAGEGRLFGRAMLFYFTFWVHGRSRSFIL